MYVKEQVSSGAIFASGDPGNIREFESLPVTAANDCL